MKILLKTTIIFFLISILAGEEKYFHKLRGKPKEGIYIEGIKFFKQGKRTWCGPAILQMLINIYDKNENQKKIADKIYDEKEKVARLSEMVYYPREKGLKSFSFRADVNSLRHLLSKRIPIIVFQKASKDVNKGHFRLVIGYENDWIIFYDPLLGENICLKEKDFLELWNFRGEKWAAIVVDDESSLDEKYKDNEFFYRDMALSYLKRGNFKESEYFWRKAFEKSQTASYLYCLAFTHLKLGQQEKAEIFVKMAKERETENAFRLDMIKTREKQENTKKTLEIVKDKEKISEKECLQTTINEWIKKIHQTEPGGGALTKKEEKKIMSTAVFMTLFIAGTINNSS